MNAVLIRPMTTDDIAACLTIEEQSSPVPWTDGIFRDELISDGRHYLVAHTNEGRLVGFCGLLAQVGEGHVTNIAVTETSRGQRIGARLMFHSIEWALRQEIRALTLEVRVGNEPALRLYRRFGFAPVGTRPRYYPNGDDALILWAHDVDQPSYQARLANIEAWLATPREEAQGVA